MQSVFPYLLWKYQKSIKSIKFCTPCSWLLNFSSLDIYLCSFRCSFRGCISRYSIEALFSVLLVHYHWQMVIVYYAVYYAYHIQNHLIRIAAICSPIFSRHPSASIEVFQTTQQQKKPLPSE